MDLDIDNIVMEIENVNFSDPRHPFLIKAPWSDTGLCLDPNELKYLNEHTDIVHKYVNQELYDF